MDRLLNLNRKHGSSTDWIICHLGSIYPKETIFNLCIFAFKEFISQQQQINANISANILKFTSIINVLNYFINLYSHYVRAILLQIFQVRVSIFFYPLFNHLSSF